MMLIYIIAIFCISFISVRAQLSLNSPQNGEKVVTHNSMASGSVEVAYTMDFDMHEHQDKKRVEACIELLGVIKGEVKTVPMPLRCYPFVKGDEVSKSISKKVVIDGLIVHIYQVNLFLREKRGENSSTLTLAGASTFRVLRPDDVVALPEIDIVRESQVAIGYGASRGTAYIPYTISDVTDKDLYALCVHITLAPTGSPEEQSLIESQAYPPVNLPPNGAEMCVPLDKGLVLQRIQPCSVPYKLRVWLHDKSTGEIGQSRDSYLQVSRLEHSLPNLAVQLDKRVLEWSLPPSGRDKEGKSAVTGGAIGYFVQGTPSAVAQVETCIELLLLEGGTADFDLYDVYGADGLEGAALEAAVDDGIASKVREEEQAEKKVLDAARMEGADLRLGLGRWRDAYHQQYPELFKKCQATTTGREGSFSLHGVPAGLYVAKLHIAYNVSTEASTHVEVDEQGNPETAISQLYYHFRQTTTRVTIAVQREREFTPSYEWQALRGWHTVPLGLETQLPMESLSFEPPSEDEIEVMGMGHDGADLLTVEAGADNVQSLASQKLALLAAEAPPRFKDPAFYGRPANRKTARIPDPWQIQLPMPTPTCRFFLRMNVYRDMTTGSILDTAAKQCRNLPPSCMSMVDIAEDGTTSVIDRSANVEIADLFNRRLKLELDREKLECVRSSE